MVESVSLYLNCTPAPADPSLPLDVNNSQYVVLVGSIFPYTGALHLYVEPL